MLHVHYLQPPDEHYLDYLRQRLGPGVELTSGETEPLPKRTQILIAGRPEAELLANLPELQTLVIPWSGLPDTTRDLMLRYPQIAVHNLHHNAAPVAELAFALLLAAAKFIIPLDRSLRAHDWRPRYRPNPSMLLRGKTALILGYGAIGQRLARLCQALEMRVLGIRRRPSQESLEAGVEVYSMAHLAQLLPQAQVLFICLPLTPDTERIIGPDELYALPKGAVLVNVGRGPVVDEQALHEALKEGHLSGAGLDVWYNYPSSEEDRKNTPPSNYPLHELDNVVLSPHRGGATNETNYLRMDGLADVLNAAERGEPLPNPVDITAGY